MTCPTFSETADWKYFNNSCLFFDIPDNVASVVKQCCPSTVTSVQNDCYSFCNFTVVPEELNLINCLHSEGKKVGLTDAILRKTHPSCYAVANDDVIFTWIGNTLTTAAITGVTTSRASLASTTSRPAGALSSSGESTTKVGGMGIPYFGGLGAQERTTDTPTPTTTESTPPQVTITLSPSPKGFGTKGIVTSKAALGLVVFALFSVFI